MENKEMFTKEEAVKALDEIFKDCGKVFYKKNGDLKTVGRQKTAEQVSAMLGAAWAMYIMGALTENEMDYYMYEAMHYVEYYDDRRSLREKIAKMRKR